MFGPLLVALAGCVGYVEQPPPQRIYVEQPSPPREVYVAPPPVREAYVPPPPVREVYVAPPPVEGSFTIRTERDFDEPLSQYGRWEVVGTYGRCWIPGRVESDWRPYSNGYWQRTDAGWYWASDEPWGWATYHYGRWDLSPEIGWFWVPQTVWAPAWVSWHRGGGYVGWAPLHPSVRVVSGGSVNVNVAVVAPRAFVIVEERKFLEPVRPATVVVNNTTIINQTVNITNIKVVNNTVINEGPRTQVIEQASGRKIESIPARDLRHSQEAEVVARRRPLPAAVENPVRVPARGATTPRANDLPPESDRIANESKSKAQEQSQRIAREAELKASRAEADRRANESKSKAQEQSQRIAREAELKASRAEADRRASEAKSKVPEPARGNGREVGTGALPSDSKGRPTDVLTRPQPKSKLHGKGKPAPVERTGTNTVETLPSRKPRE